MPAKLASFAEAWLLLKITNLPVLFNYSLSGTDYRGTPVNLIIAILLILFALLAIINDFSTLR